MVCANDGTPAEAYCTYALGATVKSRLPRSQSRIKSALVHLERVQQGSPHAEQEEVEEEEKEEEEGDEEQEDEEENEEGKEAEEEDE